MADNNLRFGEFQRQLTAGHNDVSFNDLVIQPERDAAGRLLPFVPQRIKLTATETIRLLQPYFSVRFMEQVRAVVPLGLYLALFQILFLRQVVEDSWVITAGLFAVIAGLMFSWKVSSWG